MKKLTKEEYTILYGSYSWRTSIEKIEVVLEMEKIVEILKKLEEMGLIKISYRDGEIYGFIETKEGNELLRSEEYEDWYIECGD